MKTEDTRKTPTFRNLKIYYTEDASLPLKEARGFVVPNTAPMGINQFVYRLNYQLQPGSSDEGKNIKTLALSVPGNSVLDSVYCSALNTTFIPPNGVNYISTSDTLYIVFDNPVAGAVTASLLVSFSSNLSDLVHFFELLVFNSEGNDNSGGVKVWEDNYSGSKVVLATTVDGVSETDKFKDEKELVVIISPNPANPSTTITYQLAKPSNVKLTVYSITGQVIGILVNSHKGAGTHKATFNGANLSNGVYLYRLEVHGAVKTGKMMLIKYRTDLVMND
jgi:hypothetical protein